VRADRFLPATSAIVVVLAGLVAGCGSTTETLTAPQQGTIVVEVIRTNSSIGQAVHGVVKRTTTGTMTVKTITETSGAGAEQSVLSTNSLMRPGYQQVEAGNSVELYDPKDNTIYVTTERGWQGAVTRQARQTAPKGSQSSSSVEIVYGPGEGYTPGRTSVFEQQLRAHLYKLAGRTKVDGRPALKLAPTRRSVPLNQKSGASELLGTVYLAPRTYYPIRQVLQTSGLAGGFSNTLVNDWLTYEVLPATATSRKLVSLTALHPSARIVHGATGFLAASNSASKR
jgi:hypothetical protein